jgi:hypothetical protein
VNAQQPLPRLVKYDLPPWRDAAAILTPVHPGEVVLTEPLTGYYVPAVSGAKVVAWLPPIYWVPDHEERRAAQKRFYSPVSDDERREILTRYQVHWVVLNRNGALQGHQQDRVLALGCAALQRDSLVLVDVQPRAGCASRRTGEFHPR